MAMTKVLWFHKLRKWLKEWVFQLTHTPNSSEGLRHRAERLIEEGYPLDSPYISMLLKQALLKEILKQALLKENRGEEIPSPSEWDTKTGKQRGEWVLSQLKIGRCASEKR